MRLFMLGCVSLVLFGCKDEERFIPLEQLCGEISQEICDARGSCCSLDPEACQLPEVERCTALLEQYVKEPTLRYDSVRAERQSSAASLVLDKCGAVPALASFFEGGAALGAPCERDSQCTTGSCAGEPRVCVDPAPVLLCPPAPTP